MNKRDRLISRITALLLSPLPWFRDKPDALVIVNQFIKFGIVGLSNSVVSLVVYTLGLLSFRRIGLFSQHDYLAAQVLQFILSVLWSFYWNNRFVFDDKKNGRRAILKSLAKTYITYAFSGLFLSSVLLILWVDFFHLSEFIAPVINIIICLPINFLMNKFWAFR